MSMQSRRNLLISIGTMILLGCGTSAAEDYPTRYIRVVVGPGPDITIRLFGPEITEALGQQVVIEPRPGAGGVIAAQVIAATPPDGYNLLLASASYTINTALQQMTLDLRRDFAPVGLLTTSPFILVVHPSVPAHNLAELISYAKANPGKLNYASSGIGTPPHLAGELFKSMAGLDIVHVPFREANSALSAVMSGNVQMMFAISSLAQSQIESGLVRGIGVTTLKPSRLAPDLPAIAQSGLPGFEVLGWNGLVAPKGTPAHVVEKLNKALQGGLDDADLRHRLAVAGYEPAEHNTPNEFGAFIRSDAAKWIGLVEKTHMKLH
jgi:tripartite-type tricarboxylate transporter receptor subunit TctC